MSKFPFLIAIAFLQIFFKSCEYKPGQQSSSPLKKTHIITPEEKSLGSSIGHSNGNSTSSYNTYRIVSFINGDCYCGIEDLVRWNQLYRAHPEEMKKFLIEFYVYSANYYQFIETLKSNDILKSNFIIFLDKGDEFRKLNRLDSVEENQSFLIDHDNQIIIVGDFLNEKNIRSKFFEKYKN